MSYNPLEEISPDLQV